MKLIFDCRYTRLERHDGISRYTAELVRALSRLTPVTMLISDERQLRLLPDLPWVMGTAPTSLREPWVSKIVNRENPDVVFSPMQTMGSIGRKYRFILTLHDLIYYSNPKPPPDFSWPVRAGWWVYHRTFLPVRILLERADIVVTGSYSTRSEIAAAGLTRRPLAVVRSAVDLPQFTGERTAPASRDLVYMGSFMPYKNVELAARGMQLLPGYTLHLLSRVTPTQRRRLEELSPEASLVFHDGVSDDEYLQILRSCAALISASRQEGFGIPLVEAMSQGTPLVLSDIPVFHEIGGEEAEYFDPDDVEGFAAAVRRQVEAPGWQRRSAAVLERAEEFTWDHSAKILYELAMSLMVDDEATLARR